MNGAEALVRTLADCGIEICFTNPGTSEMHFVAALDRLESHYNQSVANLRDAVRTFIATGERTTPEARASGLFTYPQLRVSWSVPSRIGCVRHKKPMMSAPMQRARWRRRNRGPVRSQR